MDCLGRTQRSSRGGGPVIERLRKPCALVAIAATLFGAPLTTLAQQPQEQAPPPTTSRPQEQAPPPTTTSQPQEETPPLPTAPQPHVSLATPPSLRMPKSYGPLAPYTAAT